MVEQRRAVFLDRDGVINEARVSQGKPLPPRDVTEVRLVSGAAGALSQLKQRGFLLIVVTNQPDVRRGTTSSEVVEDIHKFLASQLPIDDFLTCYHDDQDCCVCRKPRPGLLRQAAERHGIELTKSFLIGDRWRDIDAGAAAGCTTVLIDYKYEEQPPKNPPHAVVSSLPEAVRWILNCDRGE